MRLCTVEHSRTTRDLVESKEQDFKLSIALERSRNPNILQVVSVPHLRSVDKILSLPKEFNY